MGRKLPFLPTCGSPSRTLSFRATTISGDLHDMATATATGSSGEDEDQASIESVIKGLSTDRFFFKPEKTSSILEEAKPKPKDKEKEDEVLALKESSHVSMMEIESTDPFIDFKKSMQEMVEADEGLKEWENLQELLSWYLAVNEKINHSYIIGAFVDLFLVNLCSSSSSSSSVSLMKSQDESLLSNNSKKKMMMISSESPESGVSFTSSSASSSGTCSSSTSHCLSSCSLEEDEDEDDDDDDDDGNHGDDDEDHSSGQKAVVVLSDETSFSKV